MPLSSSSPATWMPHSVFALPSLLVKPCTRQPNEWHSHARSCMTLRRMQVNFTMLHNICNTASDFQFEWSSGQALSHGLQIGASSEHPQLHLFLTQYFIEQLQHVNSIHLKMTMQQDIIRRSICQDRQSRQSCCQSLSRRRSGQEVQKKTKKKQEASRPGIYQTSPPHTQTTLPWALALCCADHQCWESPAFM